MARRAGVLSIILTLLLAGCVGADDIPTDAEDAPADAPVVIDPDRPRESLGDIVTGPAVGPDINATTEAPPKLVAGEWWRVRFDAGILQDEVIEVVRVVADVHDDGYVFGMPHKGWLKEAIAFHAPAFGDVALDLSYMTHNERFEPLRFPLVKGASWETTFATQPLTATVEHADEHRATIVFEAPAVEAQPSDPAFAAIGFVAPAGGMRIEYDAQMHEVVRMESSIGTWEVIEHGYDFEGWVTVPRGEDTVIDYGTFGPASEDHSPAPREHEVSGGFNRLTMMHVIFNGENTPGTFRIRDVAPDGSELVTELTGTGSIIAFHEAANPDGTWLLEDVNGGAGATYSMGIAYHQYDIRLPDGLRRADHSHEVIR